MTALDWLLFEVGVLVFSAVVAVVAMGIRRWRDERRCRAELAAWWVHRGPS